MSIGPHQPNVWHGHDAAKLPDPCCIPVRGILPTLYMPPMRGSLHPPPRSSDRPPAGRRLRPPYSIYTTLWSRDCSCSLVPGPLFYFWSRERCLHHAYHPSVDPSPCRPTHQLHRSQLHFGRHIQALYLPYGRHIT